MVEIMTDFAPEREAMVERQLSAEAFPSGL